MSFNPTTQQLEAINTKGSVLVSAAAGSGKTAVLVERVIKMLSDETNPVMADKLLIVTFTNLVAAELRTKIEKRLLKEIDENPDNYLLQKQKILLSAAHICTIDSFCIDFIKENFQLSGINPSFKIADTPTANYLKKAVIEKTFEEYFEKNDADFLNLIYLVGAEYDDKTLMDFVIDIFDYSRQMPYPRLWLKKFEKEYISHARNENDIWFRKTFDAANQILLDSKVLIDNAIMLLDENENAKSAYKSHFSYLKDFTENLINNFDIENWDKIHTALHCEFEPCALGRLKSADKTELVEKALSLRKVFLENIKTLKGLIYLKKNDIIKQLQSISPYISKLVEIICKFEEDFSQELSKRNLMTFYMCEQEALSMLTEIVDDEIKVRDGIEEYIADFDAVFVDEYQDANDLQNLLYDILSDNSKKLFCVGDMKQSIYRFRGANPYNFLQRKQSGKHHVVDLGCNFRSRFQICNFINRFFSLLMYKENVGFDYDDKEKLVPKAVFPDSFETKTEIHIANLNRISDNFSPYQAKSENVAAAEANIIADIIIDKMNAPAFIKSDDNSLRKARFDDFAILYRSLAGRADIVAKTFKSRGIPVSIDYGGLLETDEVRTLISFLRVINNPNDDVSLLTLLTSPIFAFKTDEITKIRLNSRKDRLIQSVLLASANGDIKSKNFAECLAYFTERKILFDIQSLIEEIFEKTNYLNIVSRQTSGDEKRSNLLSFQCFAAESDAKKISLRGFLQSIETLSSADFKKPKIFLPDSVKLMSVHASKGLQFPVCIIADSAHQFNFQDNNSSLLLDEKEGFAFKCKNTEYQPDDNILRNIIKIKAKKELLAEELRLLYVAMTRAEEKLIIIATVDDISKFTSSVYSKMLQGKNADKIDASVFGTFRSYFEQIIAFLIYNFSSECLLTNSNSEFTLGQTKLQIHNFVNLAMPNSEKSEEAVKKNTEKVLKSYNFSYPFKALSELEAKTSVTKLLHNADTKKFEFTSKPAFMLEKGLSSAEKGTAMHKFMQFCDFTAATNDLEAEILRLYDFGYLTEKEFDSINRSYISDFFASKLYSRIKCANLVKREEKFLAEFSATKLNPDLDNAFSDEMILVQGAIDLMFFEDDGIVIVDFKTDRNSDEKELLICYAEQLKIYSLAVEKIFNMKVKELYIYSFTLKKAIKV